MSANQKANVDVTLNNEQAKKELEELQSSMKKLTELRDKAFAAGDVTAFKAYDAELKKATRSAGTYKKELFDVTAIMKNLSGTSLNDLNKALSTVSLQMKKMKPNTPEFAAMAENAKKLKSQISTVNSSMNDQKGIIGRLVGQAGALLPAFSFAAIGAAAIGAFHKITTATDTLADKWEEIMGGMNAATDYFWTTLASGDWSGFFTNLAEAARLGAAYARTLDELGDRQRALSIEEADARQKILDLEIKLKNKTLSKEERKQAGEERIKIEEDLAATRTKNADIAYKNELENNIKVKKLGKDRTMQILTDIDSQQRKEAEAYLAKKQYLDDLYAAANQGNAGTAGGSITTDTEAARLERKRLKEELASYPEAVRQYGDDIEKFGKVGDEQRDRIVKTYTDLKEAQNSAVENTKKVRTQVNSLIAGEENDDEKAKKAGNKANKSLKGTQKTPAEIAKEELDAKLIVVEAANKKEVSLITERYANQEITEDQYRAELLAQELKLISDKMALYEIGSSEYSDLETQFNQKRIEANDKMCDLLAKAAEDLSQAKIDALQEGIDKEKAIEEKRWADELKGLQDRLIKKQSLSVEEVAYNDKINALIEQKTKDHNQNVENLTASDNLKKQMDKALQLEAEAQTDDQYFAAQLAKAKATLDQELLDAGTDAKKIADAKKKYADEEVKITEEAETKKREAREKTLETANQLISGAANLVKSLMDSELQKAGDNEEKKMQIQKKYANINFALAASQIITDTASAVMKGFSQLGPIAGAISAALMVATGAVQLGIANRERKNMLSLSEGGYTGPGDKYEPAGIVHKGEYVIPQEGTTNPQVKQVVDIIEIARKNNKLATLDLPSILAATSNRGYASGGFTSSVTPVPTAPLIVQSGGAAIDPELKELIRANIEATNRLMSWQPSVAVELIQKKMQELDDIYKNSKL